MDCDHDPALAGDQRGLLGGLTDAQQQAVTHVDGPLLVLAGPGSGKTTVVTRRVAYLVSQGIPAWSILALTFTNKAAGEMRDRIESRLPTDLPGRRGLTVTTFHSFCARLLRRYAAEAGLEQNYSIYDTADQRDAVKQALTRAEMNTKNWSPASVLSEISNAKNKLLDATEYAAQASDFYHRSIAKAYAAYEKILSDNDALDFDDLLMRTANMLRYEPTVREELQDRFQYLLIDEYQDTNHAQFLIAHTLASAHKNICVVGDPDQSIYGWRGADIRNILEFEQHYPDAALVPLGQNFRSTGHIVAVAAELISHNTQRKHKHLHTELDDGEKPTIVSCRDEHHEAALITDTFRSLNDAYGTPWKEMAVVYRMNSLSRVLEEAFRRTGIPYVIARGTAFYDRKEVKDAVAYLRVIVNPNDEISLRRIINTPTRGIGKTTMERLELHAIHRQVSLLQAMRESSSVNGLGPRAIKAIEHFVAMLDDWRTSEQGTLMETTTHTVELADLVERVVRESGLEVSYARSRLEEDEERLENLGELISAASQFEMPAENEGAPEINDRPTENQPAERVPSVIRQLAAFLESIALVADADAINPEHGAVTLLTLHTAKGLEYEAVAVAGLEEGLLPHGRALESASELEEERRLAFVGMTRAKRHLLLTRASVRTHRGLRERTIPSQFLRELPEDHITAVDQSGFGERAALSGTEFDDPSIEPFYDDLQHAPDAYGGVGNMSVGALVRHPTFGVGRIEAITRRPAGSSARVAFTSGTVKTLILDYAKLELVD